MFRRSMSQSEVKQTLLRVSAHTRSPAARLTRNTANGLVEGNNPFQVAWLPDEFATILREGPDSGVHTLVWCDTATNLNRNLERRALREFAMRVAFQMSAEDSANLIDTPAASKLGPYRALLFSEDEGRLDKFRPYGLPSEQWLTHVTEQLQQRSAPNKP